MRTRLVTFLGIAISIALLVYIARSFDLRDALSAIKSAELSWLIAGAFVYSVLFVLRGARWVVLLKPLKAVSLRSATESFLVGFMANNVLPARLGDVARAFVLAKREEVPASATFSNVMLERIFDGLTVVGLLALALLLEPPSANWVSTVGVFMGLAFLTALMVSALLVWNEAQMFRLLRALFSYLPKGEKLQGPALAIAKKLASGLHTLRSPKQTVQVIGLSLLIWVVEVVVYVLVQRAFGLGVSFWGLALVMSILTLGLTAPSAPGFVGVFEGLVIAGIGLYGVSGTLAPAFAITLHLIHYIPGTLLGLGVAFGYGLRLKELKDAHEGVPIEA